MNQETIPNNNLPIYLQRYTVDIFGNKEKKYGDVLYSTVGAIPSNVKEERVWELNATGYLQPNVDKYYILYDFKDVDYEGKNIRFENILSGTFNICGQVLDATKILKFTYSDDQSTLTIEVDTKKWNFRLREIVEFSYCLNIDDSSENCSSLVYQGSSIDVVNGDCVKTLLSTFDTIDVSVNYTINVISIQTKQKLLLP